MTSIKKLLGIVILFVLSVTLHLACSTDSGNRQTRIMTSSFGSTLSHNTGQNCMSCHHPGGSGDGSFIIAGTVYDSTGSSTMPNVLVSLHSEPDGMGAKLAEIEVDELGNFYTTETFEFGDGLYTGVTGNTATLYMQSAITNGACNSCHGVDTDRIRSK